MSEDRLLRELGHLAREEKEAGQAHFDERWDRLAAGTLTPEEDAELRLLAAASPEARETYEAFRPLGADFQARVTDALAAELERPEAEAKPQEPRSRLLPFRPPALRFAGWLTTVAAVAASLFLLLRGPASGPLPVYTAELSGGVRTFRSETGPATGPQVFAPGSALMLVVRPQHSVTGEVEARAFLARGTEWMAWEPRIEIRNGAARLQGELDRQISPGEWRLWVVVGRPGKLPSITELQASLREGRTQHDPWQAVRADLRVANQPPP